MSVHSKISPSHSKRWMNCPGSIILSAKCPAPEQTAFAAEGTAAHEVAAECLKNRQNAEEWVGEVVEIGDRNFKVTEEMAENIQVYLDTILSDLEKESVGREHLQVEKKFTLPNIDKNLFGTNDASFLSPFGRLYIYDLKYGRGTYVDVENNSQCMIYALGAYYEYQELPEEIEITIVQPRYEMGDPLDRVRKVIISRAELMAFEKELREAIKRINKKDANTQVGEWCQFCPAIAICPAKRQEVFSVLPEPPKFVLPEPGALTVEQIAKVMSVSATIKEWADAVHTYAERLAKETGAIVPGYKLISKKGNRRWIDEIAVETAFEAEYGEAIYDKKLKSPAKLEKLVGKDGIAEYVEIPDKGVQLVPETAKGEAVVDIPGQVFQQLT